MKLKTAKKITNMLLAAIVVSVMLSLPSVDVRHVLMYPIVGMIIALIVIQLLFVKCPHCGAVLRLRKGRYCMRCGREVDMNE